MRPAHWSRCTARVLAARIVRDKKMRPARRPAQFDTTISPIIGPKRAVKEIHCAILCDLVRIGVGAGFKPALTEGGQGRHLRRVETLHSSTTCGPPSSRAMIRVRESAA